MTLVHHTLNNDFPEHQELIARLRAQDDEFLALADEYAEIDDQIFRLEQQIEATSDHHAHELKLRRVQLKDRLTRKIALASQGDVGH